MGQRLGRPCCQIPTRFLRQWETKISTSPYFRRFFNFFSVLSIKTQTQFPHSFHPRLCRCKKALLSIVTNQNAAILDDDTAYKISLQKRHIFPLDLSKLAPLAGNTEFRMTHAGFPEVRKNARMRTVYTLYTNM
jgi:hypothetical protein